MFTNQELKKARSQANPSTRPIPSLLNSTPPSPLIHHHYYQNRTKQNSSITISRNKNPGLHRKIFLDRKLYSHGRFWHSKTRSLPNLRHRKRCHMDPMPTLHLLLLCSTRANLRANSIIDLLQCVLLRVRLLGARHIELLRRNLSLCRTIW